MSRPELNEWMGRCPLDGAEQRMTWVAPREVVPDKRCFVCGGEFGWTHLKTYPCLDDEAVLLQEPVQGE